MGEELHLEIQALEPYQNETMQQGLEQTSFQQEPQSIEGLVALHALPQSLGELKNAGFIADRPNGVA